MSIRQLPLAMLFATCVVANGQALRNGDFEQTCDTCKTGLAFWELSWKGKNTGCAADHGALRIACLDSVDAVGFAEQAINIMPVKEPMMLTVSARVRTADLKGKGASLNVACYDEQNGFLTNKDMGLFRFNWVHGTSAEEVRTLKQILPEGTALVKIGAIVNGRGEAWFDGFTMALDPLNDRIPDKSAVAYVGAACDSIRQHALYRDSVDLDAVRMTALKIAGGNNDPADRHLAVEYLLQSLGDHHSFLMKPSEYKAWESDVGGDGFAYATHRVIEGYGYVSVPGFNSGDSLDMLAFADSLQRALHQLSLSGIKGWIVDLRQNTGGNMAPMVCGLGPLLDPGVLGTLTDVRGKVEHWYYRDGAYGWDDGIVMRSAAPVTLERKLPIAVLTAQQTGSSGECTTISFIGNSNTRSFGQPTWGLTTGNGQFELPDGAQMFMASTVMGDRHGKLFHGAIVPDEQVEQPADWSYDASLDAALKWLGVQR
ncbi:MAG: S41 family peptidase [Flavobacteriales bacterium]